MTPTPDQRALERVDRHLLRLTPAAPSTTVEVVILQVCQEIKTGSPATQALAREATLARLRDLGHHNAEQRVGSAFAKLALEQPPPQGNGRRAATKEFTLLSIGALLAEADELVRWRVDRLLSTAGVSVLVGKPKTGKSTFARALAAGVASGTDFLGYATEPGAVVYLALEEKRAQLRRAFRALGVGDNCNLLLHVGTAPADALDALRRVADREPLALIVVDTLQRLARVADLNDYATVTTALEPVLAIARETGAHVLLVHHAASMGTSGHSSATGCWEALRSAGLWTQSYTCGGARTTAR